MRTPITNAALEQSLSRDRLAKYLLAVHDDLDAALALYEKNMRLAEAFYTPLQCMEVCLRNKLHEHMTNAYGADWFQNGNAPLEADARDDISSTYRGLQHKSAVTAGDIVAELRFGFWVGLLGPRYDATLWRATLHLAFRADGPRPRQTVHSRFNALRRFRNRVAHHEPIFLRPLEQLHAETIEAIGWMCANTSAWAAHHSRFATTFATA